MESVFNEMESNINGLGFASPDRDLFPNNFCGATSGEAIGTGHDGHDVSDSGALDAVASGMGSSISRRRAQIVRVEGDDGHDASDGGALDSVAAGIGSSMSCPHAQIVRMEDVDSFSL